MNSLRRRKITLNSPTKRANLVHDLKSDGRFHKDLILFDSADGEKPLTPFFDKQAVCLGALGMELGLPIETEDLKIIQSALQRIDLPQKYKEPLEIALKNHKGNQDSWECEPKYSSKMGVSFSLI